MYYVHYHSCNDLFIFLPILSLTEQEFSNSKMKFLKFTAWKNVALASIAILSLNLKISVSSVKPA